VQLDREFRHDGRELELVGAGVGEAGGAAEQPAVDHQARRGQRDALHGRHGSAPLRTLRLPTGRPSLPRDGWGGQQQLAQPKLQLGEVGVGG
jgi:hypothetical protein